MVGSWIFRACLVRPFTFGQSPSARVGLRTVLLLASVGLRPRVGPSTPALSARSAATRLESRPTLGRKALVLTYELTYHTGSQGFFFLESTKKETY